MDKQLSALLTRTRDHKPLVTVCNLPGWDADMTPQQLRALATALCAAADESEAQPMNPKHFMRRKREYLLTSEQQTSDGVRHDPARQGAICRAA